MGVNVSNFSIREDHATPSNDSCMELHMALPVPYEEVPEYRQLLEQGDWTEVAERLVSQNPQQAEVIKVFLEAAAKRKMGESERRLEAVAAMA